MKKLSKILAVVLAVTMLFSTVSFAAGVGFSDVTQENKFYDSITILAAFGIINGYDDGTFGPDKDVTRAEFATMLMRAMASAGIGNPDPAGTPFTDLNDASWAIGDIKTAYDLGIINGMTDTTFEPNSKVTFEQALKMIVCALNYGSQADVLQKEAEAANTTGIPVKWYKGYVQVARELGLIDNVPMVQEQPAKRAHIAQMIYNALEVKVLEKAELAGGGEMYMESNQTWLKDKLKITKGRGELLADEHNTISADGATARAGYALFADDINGGTITIAKDNVSLDGLLGKPTEYYYKTDIYDVDHLVLAYTKSGSASSLKVDATNLHKVTGTYDSGFTVDYYESASATRTKSLKVAAKPIVSVNGETIANPSASDFNIEAGSLEFISSGSVYDKVNITSYETYVVKSVNRTDKYIVDMYRTAGSNTLYIDDEDNNYIITMKNSSGNSITISNLSQYNVLTVKEGKGAANRTTLDITVSNKNVSGTIKEIDTDFININGTEYDISAYLNKYGTSDLNALDIGDSCKGYLDKDGKLAYITKTASSSTYYGYIASAALTTDDTVRFALISQKTPNMGSPFVTTANKVKIDGISYSDPEEILEVLEYSAGEDNTNVDGNGTKYSQLVKYTINSSGLITEIDTATFSEKEDPADTTRVSAFEVERKSDDTMMYKSSSYDFIGASNSDKFRINSSTQVFLVPLDRSEFDSYGRKTTSFFKDSVKYIVEPYNVTGGLNIAEAVIVYETEETEAVVEYNTPLFIITSITQTNNEEGIPCDKVTGIQITSSGTVTADKVVYAEAGDIYDNYSIGDVIMYVTDNKGYVKADAIIDGLDADNFDSGKTIVKTGSTTHQTSLYRGLLLGAAFDGDSTTTQFFDIELVDDAEDCTGEMDYSNKATSSTKFFVYDPAAKGSEKITQQDSFDLTSLASYNETVETGTPDAAKLFVYDYYGAVRAIIIVK